MVVNQTFIGSFYMPTNFTGLPLSLIAGDTRQFDFENSDFPASEWVMTYYLHGETTVKITGAASGDKHVFTIPANKTDTWKEQSAVWTIVATKNELQYTVERGSLSIFANSTKNEAGQRLKDLETDLANIRAFRSGRAKKGVLKSTFAGRALDKMPLEEILLLQSTIQAEITVLKHGYSALRKTIEIRI